MVTVSLSSSAAELARTDVLVLGLSANDDEWGVFKPSLTALGFTGAVDQLVTFPGTGLAKARLVVVVSLPEKATVNELRRAAAQGTRAAVSAKATSIAVALGPGAGGCIREIAQGIHLGAYFFDRYKSKPAPKPKTATILTSVAKRAYAKGWVDQADHVAASVMQARDWVNTAPADLRPPAFANEIKAFASGDVHVTIWDEKKLEHERCGGILAVGAGSAVPPRLVKLTYSPEGAKKHLALVGKGITFDSGGLSIKTSVGMQTMKTDMAGAAAVVGAIVAIARLDLPVRVTAIVCLAENMPSGSATRPGDVLTMRSGATVEVLNTDAEGRLVLADGLTLATEAKPTAIVDVATLTGACLVALGDRTAGVMGNDDELIESVLEAAHMADEPVWHLPIPEEMASKVTSSKVADLRQFHPKPAGGALFAAEFLRSFVKDVPWAHLDMYGPSFNEDAPYGTVPVGGTGFGVQTLVQLADQMANER